MKSEWGRLWRVGGCGHDSGSSSFPLLLRINLLFCPYSSILLPHLVGHPITDNWQVRRDLGLDQADFVICLIVWAQTTTVQHAMSPFEPKVQQASSMLPKCGGHSISLLRALPHQVKLVLKIRKTKRLFPKAWKKKIIIINIYIYI